MIHVDAIFSDTLNTVDAVIGNFVSIAYQNFVSANAEMITLLFTVYVMLLGFQFVHHTHHFNLSTVTRHLIVMLCVYGMVMNWQLYNLFVYNVFTNEPGHIAKILVNNAGTLQSGGSIADALDGIFKMVIDVTIGFLGQVGFSAAGFAFIIYGLLVFIIGFLLCVFALLLFIYAKMMMAVVLALGPLFILFILWEPTKGLFSAWLNQLITIALIPIITSAILMLMLSAIHVTLPNVNLPAEDLQFYGIVPFLALTLTTTLILAQVLRISGVLGGGITLASLSLGASIASSALQKSGIAAATRSAKNWAQNKARQVKRQLFRGQP
jgi:type IV secretion system protein VirB6